MMPVSHSIFLSALFTSLENASGISNYYYEEYEDAFAVNEKKLQKEVKETSGTFGRLLIRR